MVFGEKVGGLLLIPAMNLAASFYASASPKEEDDVCLRILFAASIRHIFKIQAKED